MTAFADASMNRGHVQETGERVSQPKEAQNQSNFMIAELDEKGNANIKMH